MLNVKSRYIFYLKGFSVAVIFYTLGNSGLPTVSCYGEVCVKLMWPPVLPLFAQQATFRNLTAYIAIIILMKGWNSPERVADSLARRCGRAKGCGYFFSKHKKKQTKKLHNSLFPQQCAADLLEFDGVSEGKFAFRR